MKCMMKPKQAMTLIELVIVMVIFWVLSGVLIRTYILMSEIAVRVEQEKNVTQEVLLFSEVLQNLADRNTIDYEKYTQKHSIQYIKDNNGLVDKLYLTGKDWTVEIYSDGDCEDISQEEKHIEYHNDELKCRLVMKKWEKETLLTLTSKAYFDKLRFKIIPFVRNDLYFSSDSDLGLCDTNYLSCPHHPWFWVLGQAFSINYGKNRVSNIHIPIQQFFNLQAN